MKCSCLSLLLRISGGNWVYKTFHIVWNNTDTNITLVDVSVLINWSIGAVFLFTCPPIDVQPDLGQIWRQNHHRLSVVKIKNLCNLLTRDARKWNGLASSTEFATFEHNPHPHKETLAQRNPRLEVCSKFTTYCSSNRNSNHFQISEKRLEKSICRQINTSAPSLKEMPPASTENFSVFQA